MGHVYRSRRVTEGLFAGVREQAMGGVVRRRRGFRDHIGEKHDFDGT